MPTTVRRMQDLTVEDHLIEVPLVWGDPTDGRTITVHAAVVSREGGEQLPFLTFLQGGPGNEAPSPFHAPTNPGWLDDALAHYRVVLLDQRGTGRSTPVSDGILDELSAAEVAEYLTHLRADSIVRDAEAMREHLGAETWSTLGQSFGGFTTLAYLSTDAGSLADVFITGGLSAIGRHPDDVYALCYDKMRVMTERYYRRFPAHRDAMRRLVDLADAGRIVLPGGEVVSRSRLRSIGSLLGGDNGWQTLWSLLEHDPATNAFRYDLAAALPFGGRNPLYFVFHESSYADGFATEWSAERTEPADYRDDVTLLTGEHVRREWAQTVPAFQPWAEVVDILAAHPWPRIYDADRIREADPTGAAAIYVNDVYVPVEFSLETAALMPGVQTWVTSEHEHSGLRTGRVLPRLIELAQHRRVR
ncbi:alpha/beta fold hydrolase [Microbacterium sp. GXF7504]